MNRPHENPECRCAGCVGWDADARVADALMAEACTVARAALEQLMRPTNVKIGRPTIEGEGYAQTITAPVEVDWPPPLYAVDDCTVSFDSDGGRRALVGYLADNPPRPFPVPHDAVAVEVVTGGIFVFRGEHCEPCARVGDTVTTDGSPRPEGVRRSCL